ncbi:MAG: acetate kinase [Bacilli bacterium]|jgi:acetate kinase|nr:acetate kinase [Bacilli bacterium]MDD6419700.1 acetate kinase [Clostridium sp.]
MKLLSVNAGSSSLKFRLYEMPEEELLMKGMFERIGLFGSCYSIRIGDEKISKDVPLKDHNEAVKILLDELINNRVISSLDEIEAVGNRVVHGGNKYSKSVEITDRVLMEIEEISDLAPLHNPAALKGIYAFKKNIPNAKLVACFDTAFHQTMKEKTYLYPVPYEWYVKYDVRKYGFHGLSHKFITEKMKEMLGKNPNLIICHIGNGASITAVKDGKSIDTSMGFTPNAGIMMGTRSGDIDYSILSYIMKKEERNLDWMDSQLNKKSGLEGIAGMSDLRDIDRAYEARDAKALLALDMYTDKIVDYVAKYYVKLGGEVDAICFTAGGGENDDIIRKEAINKLYPLGIYLDEEKNKETIVRKGVEGIISSNESKIPVYVLATDEELMIARDTYDLSVEE